VLAAVLRNVMINFKEKILIKLCPFCKLPVSIKKHGELWYISHDQISECLLSTTMCLKDKLKLIKLWNASFSNENNSKEETTKETKENRNIIRIKRKQNDLPF
jgi:hypothetical protein